MPPEPSEKSVERMNRLALVLLGTSAVIGLACTGLGMLFWALEWAVAAGIGGIALVWGFLGSLSWAASAGAERVEQAVTTASIHRRLRAGTADPQRAAVSLVEADAVGQLSAPTVTPDDKA